MKTITQDSGEEEGVRVRLSRDLPGSPTAAALGRQRGVRPLPAFPWTAGLPVPGRRLSGGHGMKAWPGLRAGRAEAKQMASVVLKTRAAAKLLIENRWAPLRGNDLGCSHRGSRPPRQRRSSGSRG